MFWIGIIVHWLHVFLAIFWFGGVLFVFAVMTPALKASAPPAALEVGAQMGSRLTKVMAPVGGLTILFGIINAIVFGPVKSLDVLWTSAYGVTVLIAFLVAIGLAVLGARTGQVGMAISTATDAQRPLLLERIGRMTGMAVSGFVVVLICMVLMRFGL
ncbi:MAG: hypothetical protein JO195_03145 [Candidatus Eremiobacteraeota bacterium]|nr:hypothetical protein [Candidatus Eremiobacteraeota bacterium]MBV8595438.1 hypothetical protein [Candidatus Eremiobacteraeota bacterium]